MSNSRRRWWFVPLAFIFLLQFHQTTWGACVSWCGKIGNISRPFRLKGEPDECGEKRYELECINNVAVLRLFSGEFYVQSINYNNYTIRLVDPNIHDSNCSSMPRYLLYRYNFSERGDSSEDAYRATQLQENNQIKQLFGHVIYMECTANAVRDDDLDYVQTESCLHDASVYAIDATYWFPASKVRRDCRLKVVSPTSESFWSSSASYQDIYGKLVYGFDVSWLHGACDSECGFGGDCFFNASSQALQCVPDDCSLMPHKCLGNWKMFLDRVEVFLLGLIYGIYTVITSPKSEIRFQPEETIGRYVLTPFLAFRVLLGLAFIIALLIYKWRRRHLSNYENIEHFLQHSNLSPIRYSYREIKRMTNDFKVKLGQGGFGSVYKGKLRSGPYVAIKMLGKSKDNGQEFINEVATIGRIHHFNVVRLVGFCIEGIKRALVYEFMPNGSLDKFIFSKEGNISLSYEKIYEISLSVARGIAYLHHGCDIQILHFDIKPHNILLDDNFTPKVADFGLAKLYPINNSIVTLTAARGTIGYMAPELFYQNIGGVSYKADVYSFGKLLMEMASRRRNLKSQDQEHSSQSYFPFWIYDQLNEEKDIRMENVTDEEKEIAKKMFIVALWCIQLKPSERPSMNKVIEMLEGEIGSLEMPPKPSLFPCDEEGETEGISSYQTDSFESIIEIEMDQLSAGS